MAKRGKNDNANASSANPGIEAPGTRTSSSANLGFEAKLWLAADKLRNNMDAAEYKHVVLGLIFLKYISDSFEEHHARLVEGKGDFEGADPEERDEYLAHNVFWVPKEARWPHLQANAKQPTIGKILDDAMVAIERDNPRVKGVLPKNYARPALDTHRLGELIDLIGSLQLGGAGSGSKDILGRVFEYFFSQFASAEGKNGGQFYTPSCVVRTLVQMLSPYKGRVYDPCCGSGGMFVQSEKFVEAHGGRIGDIAIYGQESNSTTRNLAIMNLAIRGIEADFGPEHADTFRRDLHKDLKAQFVLANPPFNDSDWHRVDDDVRWQYGTPPKGNANFAWVQHFIHHLAPDGMAGFVLANGSMSSNQSGEGDIRKAIIEADLVDCMVAMPGQLFYSTQIPVCLWFLTRDKSRRPPSPQPSPSGRGGMRDRRRQTLFVDARKMGTLIDRVHRELTDADIAKIADTYHAWRSSSSQILNVKSPISSYADIPGFSKSATTALFPANFQASPLGPIPKGWAAQRLPDAIEVNPRRILHAGTIAPYLEMKNLPTQGHSAKEVIDREFTSGTKFQNGDTLLASITPCLENGKTGYVDFLKDGQVGWGSTEYIVLAPKPPLPPQFGYLLARSDALRTHAIQNMTGTSGRQRIPSECFNSFLLAVPTAQIASEFDELTAPLMAKIKTNSDQSRTLTTLRDTLLPKLLSGKLSSQTCELMAEEAA